MSYAGLAGGTIIGLEQFVNQRRTFLASAAEYATAGPTISEVQASAATPQPGEPVHMTARVEPAGNPVATVELFYRPDPTQPYLRTPMRDDGASGDGAAGDGVYGVLLPIPGARGQRVDWYVGATAANAFQSASFSPALAERGPRRLEYFLGGTDGVRITEFMYAGAHGEFIELTNLGTTPVDLAGWSLDDSNAVPGAFPLSAIGVLAPGESAIVTENVAETFRAAWNLPPSVKIIGELGATLGNNLGRNDQIHVFDPAGGLVDRLFYGDQTFPGTIRTQNRSGQAPCSTIGNNQIAAWVLATIGDAYGSVASSGATPDIGSPGRYLPAPCLGEVLFANGFE